MLRILIVFYVLYVFAKIYSKISMINSQNHCGTHCLRDMSLFWGLVLNDRNFLAQQGAPAEVYSYGMEYILMTLATFSGILVAHTFIPLYLRLNINSVYEVRHIPSPDVFVRLQPRVVYI